MAERLTELFVKVGADTTGLDRGLKNAEASTQGFANKFGKQMKVAGMALVGITAAIGGASIKMASDFDSAMREVNTMMLLSEEQFSSFSKEVRTMAREIGVSATDSAKALYQAISAGVPKENVVEFLSVATKAAIGGVTDTTTAVDGLTTVLNAFKIPVSKAQEVADIMFTTVKGGKTTFEELSASLYNVAPIAAASGVKFEEVAAALASITKQGVPTAVATTQLRAAIQALTAPTAQQKTMMEELGIQMDQATMQNKGLAGAFNMVSEATGGNMEQLRKLVGSVEAVQAILALTGPNAQTFRDDLDAMTNSAGAATEAFDQMEQTTARKFEKMKAGFADIGISLGTALLPVLQRIFDIVGPIITKIGEWMEKNKDLAAVLLILVGAGGALLLFSGMLNNVITLIPKVIGMLASLGTGFIALAAKAWAVVAPLVVAAAAKIWAWASAIPIAGLIIGAAGTAALIASIVAVKHGVAALAEGGIVKKPTLAVLGERGPEAVVPLGAAGAGMGNIYITVEGSIWQTEDLAEAIREQLILIKNRNVSLGF